MKNTFFENTFGLEGKTALVTGASRGLGQGIAIGLAKAGANIAAVSTKIDNLAETKKIISDIGREVITLECDQRDSKQIDAVIDATMSRLQAIDILVNNAGTIRRAPAHLHSDEDWMTVIDTNLTGVFRFCREVGKIMLDQKGGKIINIASLLSFSGGITVPSYAASKGAVMQLTKAFANEWAQHNIQVNAIAPGYFATDNTENLRADEQRYNQITDRIPSGEWGQPEDLEGAAVFLASNAANYVNGHILLVDGGWMAR